MSCGIVSSMDATEQVQVRAVRSEPVEPKVVKVRVIKSEPVERVARVKVERVEP